MINFSDLSGQANANITQPISNAREAGYNIFEKAIANMRIHLKEEAAIKKQIADEMIAAGKVEFVGGAAKAFQDKVKELRSQMIDDMSKYASVQGYLNSGGYEKIAKFRNDLQSLPEYQSGIQSTINYKASLAMIQNQMKPKFDTPTALTDFLEGKRPDLPLLGSYNNKPLQPEDLIVNPKAEKDEKWDSASLESYLTGLNYDPETIKQYVEANDKMGGFQKATKDYVAEIKQQQFELQKAGAEFSQQAKLQELDLKEKSLQMKLEQLQFTKDAKRSEQAYKDAELSLKKEIAAAKKAKDSYVLSQFNNDWVGFEAAVKNGQVNDGNFETNLDDLIYETVKEPVTIKGQNEKGETTTIESKVEKQYIKEGVLQTATGKPINFKGKAEKSGPAKIVFSGNDVYAEVPVKTVTKDGVESKLTGRFYIGNKNDNATKARILNLRTKSVQYNIDDISGAAPPPPKANDESKDKNKKTRQSRV